MALHGDDFESPVSARSVAELPERENKLTQLSNLLGRAAMSFRGDHKAVAAMDEAAEASRLRAAQRGEIAYKAMTSGVDWLNNLPADKKQEAAVRLNDTLRPILGPGFDMARFISDSPSGLSILDFDAGPSARSILGSRLAGVKDPADRERIINSESFQDDLKRLNLYDARSGHLDAKLKVFRATPAGQEFEKAWRSMPETERTLDTLLKTVGPDIMPPWLSQAIEADPNLQRKLGITTTERFKTLADIEASVEKARALKGMPSEVSTMAEAMGRAGASADEIELALRRTGFDDPEGMQRARAFGQNLGGVAREAAAKAQGKAAGTPPETTGKPLNASQILTHLTGVMQATRGDPSALAGAFEAVPVEPGLEGLQQQVVAAVRGADLPEIAKMKQKLAAVDVARQGLATSGLPADHANYIAMRAAGFEAEAPADLLTTARKTALQSIPDIAERLTGNIAFLLGEPDAAGHVEDPGYITNSTIGLWGGVSRIGGTIVNAIPVPPLRSAVRALMSIGGFAEEMDPKTIARSQEVFSRLAEIQSDLAALRDATSRGEGGISQPDRNEAKAILETTFTDAGTLKLRLLDARMMAEKVRTQAERTLQKGRTQ